MQVIPAIDLEGGRSRVVYWPGAAAGIGAPTDRPERIAERFVAMGAPLIHLVDFEGARTGAPANLDAIGAIASKVAVPLQVAGGVDAADAIRLAFAAGATRVVLAMGIADRPDDLLACLAVAGDWLAVGLDPRPERLAAFPWRRPATADVEVLVGELVGHGVDPLRADPWRLRTGRSRGRPRSFGRTMRTSSSPAGSAISAASAACATAGVARRDPRRGPPLRSDRLPAALEAAA